MFMVNEDYQSSILHSGSTWSRSNAAVSATQQRWRQ